MHNCIDELKHRGPDEGNIFVFDNVCLGHRRLSIIDVAESHQPFIDPSGRYGLVYNGEIYNYKELRSTLMSRWHFKTRGDTEVLLAGIILYGIHFVQKMEGMWAFAFWDNLEKKLILCRDRVGKKPLYYVGDKNDFFAASELPALKKLSLSNWLEDLHGTADYFRYGFYLPGNTAYKDVKEILPGHYLIWHSTKPIVEKRYWKVKTDIFYQEKKLATEKLKSFLIEAVEKRMVADVEVGAFLSGGIDSSLIVGIMSKELGLNPKTFTIGFNDSSFDESRYARQIADTFKTQHYEEKISSLDVKHLNILLSKHVGQPFIDSSILPTSIVSKLAGQYVKVALSGDGADELFSGYQRYQALTLLRWYSRLPAFFRSNINKLIRFLPEPTQHHSRSLLKKANLFLDIASRNNTTMPYIAPKMYSEEVFKLLLPQLQNMGNRASCLPEQTLPEDFKTMMVNDLLIYLPQDILQKVDRASMAFSLETRAPFLDSKVIELAFSCPAFWHRKFFQGKRMLKETFSGLLPSSVWQRRKQGFSIPIHQWFRDFLAKELINLLHEVKSPLNINMVKLMLEEHQRQTKDNSTYLWQCYIYLKWKKNMEI